MCTYYKMILYLFMNLMDLLDCTWPCCKWGWFYVWVKVVLSLYIESEISTCTHKNEQEFQVSFFSVLHIFIGWVSTLLLAFTCTCTCTCILMDMQLKIGNSVITEDLSLIVKCRKQCLWCSLLSFSLTSDQGVWYM